MCCSVGQGVPAAPVASRDLLRAVCEPFFEQMVSALQETLQQQSLQGQPFDRGSMQSAAGTCFQSVFCPTAPFYHIDDESTEANDSCAFASSLSGPSSETDGFDITESKSEGSDPASDIEKKDTMVCRHWKSKGWCRMESKCKFLHPENKRGLSAPSCRTGSNNIGDGARAASEMPDTLGAEAVSLTLQRRKKGGKNRSTKKQQDQSGNTE